jgi:regulator of sigma E protease
VIHLILTILGGILLLIIVLAPLVIAHEFGHFVMARRNGVRVDEFGIGFPPRAGKGRQVGETLYTLNWLPLGGFVRLAGEDGESSEAGTFAAASLWAKTKILLAGVTMNLIIAVGVLFLLCLVGIPGLGSQFEPSFLHPSYAQPKQLILTSVETGSPAASIGLKRDDYILSANGQNLTTETELQDFTAAHAGKTVTLVVRESGTTTTKQVTLRQPNSDGILGVSPQQVYKLRYSPLDALIAAIWITGALFVATIVAVVTLIIHIPSLIVGLFGSGVPASAQAASGPVGIVYILTHLGGLGLAYFFLFVANISVALAAFNVLPLPALDGGRLAVAYVRRLSGGRISSESEGIYHSIGFIALIGLVIIITIYDLRKF